MKTSRLKHPRTRDRRGAALAAAVLLVAMMNLAIIAVVLGGGDDARIAGGRAETIRAFLAAESGVAAVITEINAGRTPPTGDLTFPGGEQVEVLPFAATTPIDIVVYGRFGQSQRRIEIQLN